VGGIDVGGDVHVLHVLQRFHQDKVEDSLCDGGVSGEFEHPQRNKDTDDGEHAAHLWRETHL